MLGEVSFAQNRNITLYSLQILSVFFEVLYFAVDNSALAISQFVLQSCLRKVYQPIAGAKIFLHVGSLVTHIDSSGGRNTWTFKG